MIKLVKIETVMGQLTLVFEASFPDGSTKTVAINFSEIQDVFREIKKLLGREPTLADFKDVVKAYINKVRERQAEAKPSFSVENLLGVDLEEG